MKQKLQLFLVMVILMAIVACANLQKAWENATPEERCRIVTFKMQRTLNGAFDAGKLYILAHPEKAPEWKAKAISTFDFTNKLIRTFTEKNFAGMTSEQVILEVQPKINEILALLATWGVIVNK